MPFSFILPLLYCLDLSAPSLPPSLPPSPPPPRKYGYRTTPELMALLKANDEIQHNLSAVAHLVHRSPSPN